MSSTLKTLNVKIGADITDLQKNMQKAANVMRREGQRLSQLGNELTMTITAPLAGLGIAAIKSAGDMEALTNALKTTMGDATAAAAEIELLRKEALKPGLNFEQALKGSVRLQAVGLDAETARKALGNFGNALALAGGRASDLDGVTLALTQIISKGKVSAEEINQLAERVPQIRKIMKDVFGTADTEELQKMNIAAEDFVKKVTDEFGKLPQATGGIQNALENMAVAGKQALADLGLEINKMFNITGKAEQFAAMLAGLVEKFRNLDDSTKRMIVTTAAIVAAIGPVIKIYGVLKMTVAQVITGFTSMIGVLKSMSGAVVNAIASFQKMDMAMKATTIGLVVVGIGAAIAAFQHFSREADRAKAAQVALNEVNKDAAKMIAAEKVEAESLINVIKSETASKEDKRKALERLNAISSEYFGGLNIEKSTVAEITAAYDGYIEQLLRAARVRAAQDKLIELEKQRIELVERLNRMQAAGGLKKAFLEFEGIAGESMLEFAAKEIKKVEDAQKALADMIFKTGSTANTSSVASNTPKTAAPKLSFGGSKGKTELETFNRSISETSSIATLAASNVTSLESVVRNLTTTVAETNAPQMESLADVLERMSGSYGTLGEAVSASMAMMVQSTNQGAASLKNLGKVALKAAADVLRAKIIEGVSSVVADSLKKFGLFGLAIGAGAGVAAGALFNKVIGALKIPALAEGGIAYAPQMAIVGDNPGARTDPEVIAPLSKLQRIMGNNKTEVSGTVRVSGSDLLILLDNANRNRNRTRGF